MVDVRWLPAVGTVHERFQSYNIEMAAVTGAEFWKPYGAAGSDLFAYRPPRDLADQRLRSLAAALGPAYVRVSGTWANSTWFADTDPAPADPPAGFVSVLARDRWQAVLDFAAAVDADIVSSFAVSAGTRDASGRWTPDHAQRQLDHTRAAGSAIVAAEFMNEPSAAAMGGAPDGYDAAAYGRDFAVFARWAREAVPDMIVLGPGSIGDAPAALGFDSGSAAGPAGSPFADGAFLDTADLLSAGGGDVDAFSYHHYYAVSQRAAAMGMPNTSPDDALSTEFLDRTEIARAHYAELRDRFAPGRPLWLTETADAAAGGNPWAGTFLDCFRYADQLGLLARAGVQVVMHNTLESSDYALLDENDLTPKPTYWTALLWRTLMGSTVLDAGTPSDGTLRLYAHNLRGVPGGVALLAINTARDRSHRFVLPVNGVCYTLTADPLDSRTVALSGTTLDLGPDDELPELTGVAVPAGDVILAPATITFVAVPAAENPACG